MKTKKKTRALSADIIESPSEPVEDASPCTSRASTPRQEPVIEFPIVLEREDLDDAMSTTTGDETFYTADENLDLDELSEEEEPFPEPMSFIHDPGNGPRVKDIGMFLRSPFAAPPMTEDPAALGMLEAYPLLIELLPNEFTAVCY